MSARGRFHRSTCMFRHAASVHPEPGSNSPFKRRESLPAEVRSWFRPPRPRLEVRGAQAPFQNRLLGFSLLRCSVSGFRPAAPLPARRFQFHLAQGDILRVRCPAVRTFFEILGLFSRRLPAPGAWGAAATSSPAEKAARACYPLRPRAQGHFQLGKARSERPGARGRAARGGRIPVPAARSRRRAGAWPMTMPRLSCFGPTIALILPSYTASQDDRWSPRLPVMVDATLSQAAASCRPCHRRHRP